MAGNQDKGDETDIGDADDQQIEPVSQATILPIVDDCNRYASQRDEQQFPGALVDFPLHQAGFEAGSELEALNCGYDMQQAPDDI